MKSEMRDKKINSWGYPGTHFTRSLGPSSLCAGKTGTWWEVTVYKEAEGECASTSLCELAQLGHENLVESKISSIRILRG